MAIGLKLDSLTHDLINTDGELVKVTNADEITRNVNTRLRMVKTEHKLDESYGFPYKEILGGKIFDLSAMETTIKRFILETEGVTELTKFNITFARGDARKLSVQFSCKTIFGRIDVTSLQLTL